MPTQSHSSLGDNLIDQGKGRLGRPTCHCRDLKDRLSRIDGASGTRKRLFNWTIEISLREEAVLIKTQAGCAKEAPLTIKRRNHSRWKALYKRAIVGPMNVSYQAIRGSSKCFPIASVIRERRNVESVWTTSREARKSPSKLPPGRLVFCRRPLRRHGPNLGCVETLCHTILCLAAALPPQDHKGQVRGGSELRVDVDDVDQLVVDELLDT
jgi:hypothetical protein